MSWIDVAIPGVIGFLLLASPQWLVKSTGDEMQDVARTNKIRRCGLGLLVITATYLFILLASGR